MNSQDLALRFESLGDNCEFGFVQRRMGAEPIGLLRFASIPLPQLIFGIHERFHGIGNHVTAVQEGDFVLKDRLYEISYHTRIMAGDAETIVRQQAPRLKFLARKLIEDIAGAEKIFVLKRTDGLTLADVLPLHHAMRALGPATLLWVTTDGRPGTVRFHGHGLWQGFVDRFAPWSDTNELSLDPWLAVCRTAVLMADQANERMAA